MSNKPLISIIMPCYGMGKYIGEALESVGKQTYENWEVIAVDDCGPEDGTKEIVESFASEYPEHRVELIRHEENKGVSAARNTAIKESRGEFLAFLDPDDYWGASYLTSHVTTLQANDHISVSYTDARCINQNGELTGKAWGGSKEERQGLPLSLHKRNFINPSMVVAIKQDVISCGGFDEAAEMQHVEDWDLWLRMTDAGKQFAYSSEAESFYRKHPAAATTHIRKMLCREMALWRKRGQFPDQYALGLLGYMARRMEEIEKRLEMHERSLLFRISRRLAKLASKFR